jgi:hypothetical protein
MGIAGYDPFVQRCFPVGVPAGFSRTRRSLTAHDWPCRIFIRGCRPAGCPPARRLARLLTRGWQSKGLVLVLGEHELSGRGGCGGSCCRAWFAADGEDVRRRGGRGLGARVGDRPGSCGEPVKVAAVDQPGRERVAGRAPG